MKKRAGNPPPTSGCACAHPMEPHQGSRHFWQPYRSCAMVLLYYYYSKKNTRETQLRMRAPKGTPSGQVTSGSPIGHARWYYYYSSSTKCTGCACARDHFRQYHLAPPPQIRLCPCPYTTHIFSGITLLQSGSFFVFLFFVCYLLMYLSTQY